MGSGKRSTSPIAPEPVSGCGAFSIVEIATKGWSDLLSFTGLTAPTNYLSQYLYASTEEVNEIIDGSASSHTSCQTNSSSVEALLKSKSQRLEEAVDQDNFAKESSIEMSDSSYILSMDGIFYSDASYINEYNKITDNTFGRKEVDINNAKGVVRDEFVEILSGIAVGVPKESSKEELPIAKKIRKGSYSQQSKIFCDLNSDDDFVVLNNDLFLPRNSSRTFSPLESSWKGLQSTNEEIKHIQQINEAGSNPESASSPNGSEVTNAFPMVEDTSRTTINNAGEVEKNPNSRQGSSISNSYSTNVDTHTDQTVSNIVAKEEEMNIQGSSSYGSVLRRMSTIYNTGLDSKPIACQSNTTLGISPQEVATESETQKRRSRGQNENCIPRESNTSSISTNVPSDILKDTTETISRDDRRQVVPLPKSKVRNKEKMKSEEAFIDEKSHTRVIVEQSTLSELGSGSIKGETIIVAPLKTKGIKKKRPIQVSSVVNLHVQSPLKHRGNKTKEDGLPKRSILSLVEKYEQLKYETENQHKMDDMVIKGITVEYLRKRDPTNTDLHIICFTERDPRVVLGAVEELKPMAAVPNKCNEYALHYACMNPIWTKLKERETQMNATESGGKVGEHEIKQQEKRRRRHELWGKAMKALVHACPNAAREENMDRCVPLHLYCLMGAPSVEVVQSLLAAFPEGVTLQCEFAIPFNTSNNGLKKSRLLQIETPRNSTCMSSDNPSSKARGLVGFYLKQETFLQSLSPTGKQPPSRKLHRIEKGKAVPPQSKDVEVGWTPLHIAAVNVSNIESLQFILQAAPWAWHIQTSQGRNPLDCALSSSSAPEAVKHYLQNYCTTNDSPPQIVE